MASVENDICVGKIRVPVTRTDEYYVAHEDGIYEQYDELDEEGTVICSICKKVLPKEAFIVAYNAYIKGESE